MTTVESLKLGKASRINDAAGRYIEFCKSTVPMRMDLEGIRIVVDCAHGATYHIAPRVFEELGAEVISIGVEPDGLNINENCGSTKPEILQASVVELSADVGIALDGDGDRLIMVDAEGNLVDGDQILYVIAMSRLFDEQLDGSVVGTVMSNLGLEHALKEQGIGFCRSKVGDRHVMNMLRESGWSLGGESSGHIICLDRTSTGDGIVAALQVLYAMVSSHKALDQLLKGLTLYPQTLINIPLDIPFNFDESEIVKAAMNEAEYQLGDTGRILLRASGTEPLLRVMVEGSDGDLVQKQADLLADAVREASLSHSAQSA